MTIDRGNRDDELREVLRGWDPARGDVGLDPAEAARMRRAVVEAGTRRPAWVPRLAWGSLAAAALVLVALAGRGLVRETAPEPPPAVATTPGATEPGEEPTTLAAATPPDSPEPEPLPIPPASEPAGVTVASSAAAPVVPEPVVTANLPEAAAARDPRQVQFTAPGGTRIIWTLDPDFRL